jgi:beta-glucosidase
MVLPVLALLAAASLVSAAGDWDEAHKKAAADIAKISQNDKVSIVSGVGWNKGPCVGNTAAVGSIRYPQLCLQDGPLGIRFGKSVTAFTPGIQAASTWDIELMRQRGQYMGAEAKGCGVHVLLGPVAGPLGKVAQVRAIFEFPCSSRGLQGADSFLQ